MPISLDIKYLTSIAGCVSTLICTVLDGLLFGVMAQANFSKSVVLV